MKELEQQVRDAFDEVKLPASVRADALAAISALEADEKQNESSAQSAAPKARISVISRTRHFAVAVAACLVLCVVGFAGFTGFTAETAQVDIDINPSLELGLNALDRVVAVRPLNDDAARLVEGADLWGKTYDEAMVLLSDQQAFDDFVTRESYVQISVVADNDGQQDSLQASSQEYLQTLPCEGSCKSATAEQRQEAQEQGMGVGRYEAAQKLMALDGSVTLDDCRSMTMRQLRDAIQAAGGDASTLESGTMGEGNGTGAGNGSGQGAGNGAGQGGGLGAAGGQGTRSGRATGSAS